MGGIIEPVNGPKFHIRVNVSPDGEPFAILDFLDLNPVDPATGQPVAVDLNVVGDTVVVSRNDLKRMQTKIASLLENTSHIEGKDWP